jgi:exopolysaccharide biosynthesis polyprenyl glycosylphosphotransferase
MAFALGYFVLFRLPLFAVASPVWLSESYFGIMIFITLAWLFVFNFFGLYRRRFESLLDEIAFIAGMVLIGIIFLVGMLFVYREFWFSRQVILYASVFTVAGMFLVRAVIEAIQRLLFSRGVGISKVLIVGAGESGRMLARKIKEDAFSGYQIMGFLDNDPKLLNQSIEGIPVLDNTSKLKQLVAKFKVEEVFIAMPNISSPQMLDLVTECDVCGVTFKLLAGELELLASRVSTDEVAGVPLVLIREIGLMGISAFLKRTFDILFSAVMLILLLPLFLIVTLLIKAASKGPVFYTQDRVGKDSAHFRFIKFRSMVADADKMKGGLAALNEAEGHLFKIKDDPRLTPIGKFMRKFSIDELPQFMNVLLGQMSVVGPRPPLPDEVKNYNAWQKKRLRIRPGITGIWQVSGRSDLPFDDMVRLDIYYIENWSLWMDIKLVLRTIPVVLQGKGAY